MRILYLAAAADLVAGGVTACGSGSGSKPAVTSSPTLDTAAKEAKARQFVACARQHGIPNLADPTVESDGDIHLTPPPGLSTTSPLVQRVLQICGKYLDGVRNDQTEDPSAEYDKALKLADCIRKHGVPNFPDPSPPDSSGGIHQHADPGINRAALDQAMRACGATPKAKPQGR